MIADRLRSVANRHGGHVAIVDGDLRITYSELISRIDAARSWLRTMLDPQPGDVIAAAINNSWQFVACFFAVVDLGCVLVPCNPQWRAAELRSLAERLPFRGAIIESRLNSEWRQIDDLLPPEHLLCKEDLPQTAESRFNPQTSSASASKGSDPVLYVVTSGSTGKPHIVPRSSDNTISITDRLRDLLGVDPGSRFLTAVPAHHLHGFSNTLMLPLLNGATVVMMPRFTAYHCAQLIHREKVDVLFGSPFIDSSLVEHVQDPGQLSSLKSCLSGAGRTPAGVLERWHARFGVKLRKTYGMSEAAMIAFDQSDAGAPASADNYVGLPLPGVEVSAFAPDGALLGPGEIGELAIKSPGLMSGYIAEPELNRERFQNGWFRTGDLGYRDASGNLYLTGRLGRLISILGVKVDPAEVERAIEMLPSVASCHVDAVPDGAGGHVIRARVVHRPGFQVTRREVIEQCRRQLAEYKFPRVIEFLHESPLTLTGKVMPAATESNSEFNVS